MPPANVLIAGTVMDAAASLLNDTAKSVYTYAAQIPYLRIALRELRTHLELHAIPVVEAVTAVIQLDAGDTEVTYATVPPTPGVPVLPDDFVEPQKVWESPRDQELWIPMTRKEYLPHQLEGQPIANFIYFVWQEQKIKVLPTTQDNDIKIDYLKELFQTITDQNSVINVVNSQSFLEYRTAALCAEFIERNLVTSGAQNNYAKIALDVFTGISSKSKQTINTRRRPFRSAYKRRSPML